MASEPTQNAAYATMPAQAAYSDAPPPLPTWVNQPTTTGGIAGLASGPAIAPEQPIRSHKRRNIMTVISTLVVLGLIGGGAYWAYAAFAARNANQLARYFPSNTVAFASVDLVAAANNNFHINPVDLVGAQASALQKATGLDWQKDVVSWAGPDVALGVFPLSKAQTGANNPVGQVGVVALVQSRDDGAARAAIGKLNAHLKQQGTTTKTSNYRGFTLYAPGSDTNSGFYGSGGGWVIIASNADAAHAVIDRINGGSDLLSDQQPFKDATDNLPSNHFGTYYLNLRELLNSVVPVRAPNGLASVSIPFVESYPVAGGYLGWTDTGERSQLTFNAVRNPNIPDVSGDTTSFAKLVPADAMAYAGVGNLGKLVQAFITQFGSVATGADPLQSSLGVSASDPLAQTAVGVAALKSANNGVQPVFYVHVSGDAAATQAVNKLAAAHNWVAKPTTVAGKTATGLYQTSPIDVPPTNNGTPGATGESAQLVAIAFTVNNTLVLAPDMATANTIVQVAQGGAANLSSNATFVKMTKAAPSGAAATAYIGTSALQSLTHMGGAAQSAQSAFFSHFDVLALTLVWNNSMLQGTFDAGLHS